MIWIRISCFWLEAQSRGPESGWNYCGWGEGKDLSVTQQKRKDVGTREMAEALYPRVPENFREVIKVTKCLILLRFWFCLFCGACICVGQLVKVLCLSSRLTWQALGSQFVFLRQGAEGKTMNIWVVGNSQNRRRALDSHLSCLTIWRRPWVMPSIRFSKFM